MAENIEFPCFVADCSFIASFFLADKTEDEPKTASDAILSLTQNNGQIIVPPLFWYEIGNVLLNCTKPSKITGVPRITKTECAEIQRNLSLLPIATDSLPDNEIRSNILVYAEQYALSYYDASYIELAVRLGLKLKTFDKDLKAAADAENI